MTIDSVEEEYYQKLMNECQEKKDELEKLKEKTIESMWLDELNVLEKQYKKYQKERTDRLTGVSAKKVKKMKLKKMKIKKQ